MREWVAGKWFDTVHGRNLVYNQCWEDPRLDREALALTDTDSVMVITSGGCNVLDYALTGPKAVHAVDVNPRQNALLELKVQAIKQLTHAEFFDMFGRGRVAQHREVYQDALRQNLSESAQRFWDRNISYFSGKGWRTSFYFHGTSGMFARLINSYIDQVARVRGTINEILEAPSIDHQRDIYESSLKAVFWSRFMKFAMGRDMTLSLLGVPRAQRAQLDQQYKGGIVQFMVDCVEAVFAQLSLQDNYFWRVYLTGEYTQDCCPEYLKAENFDKLKNGLVDRIHWHTTTVEQFLRSHDEEITRFVLLDHMDWLAQNQQAALQSEWQAIVDRASDKSRVLWRSAGLSVDFVDPLQVELDGKSTQVGELLTYQDNLAENLHPQDRVHTYGSFYIADMVKS